MDKDVRNAIERATQKARRILEEDFAEQLDGVLTTCAPMVASPRRAARI